MADLKKKQRKDPKGGRSFKKRDPKWKIELKEIQETVGRYETIDDLEITKFSDLPLSKRTLKGLRDSGYSVPTDIQAESIPLILRGRDVLGAAKTGSGKTLAFLVPLLELLWRERWSEEDGLGALVISPTRELAYQTFEVLRVIGSHHDFSAGLVIGGKDVSTERSRIRNTNIVICTPGRLLQHMDETAHFDSSSLKILVLDEADRCLDLGFQHTMNAIIENLPLERQTLLFSATQTKSVRDLARLSLNNPEYIAVHENSKTSTPHKLTQSYITCELHEKLGVLYSFIRSHTTSKVIVFMSCCKQVKYIYEAFRRLRPGVPLMALYGRQKQARRVGIYNDFCKKRSAVLLCTDIAARGLDFPAVQWVVQLDCPEDANTYIHRVGRTARYEKDGNAILILLPSEEEAMLEALKAKKIPVDQIRANPKKLVSIQNKLEVFCAQDSEMKHWAQRSFICYLRSVHLQSNKKIFNIHKLPTDEYSQSLGLAQPPRIRFLQKSVTKVGESTKDLVEESSEEEESSSDDEEGDLLKVKRIIQPTQIDQTLEELQSKTKSTKPKVPTKVSAAKKILNKKIQLNSHIKFESQQSPECSDSESDNVPTLVDVSGITPVDIDDYHSDDDHKIGGIRIKSARKALQARDKMDRKRERQRVKEAHREKRRKDRLMLTKSHENVAILGEPSDVFDSSNSEDEESFEPDKKKVKMDEQRITAMGLSGDHQLGTDSTQVALGEDEELALHLLTS